MTTLDSSKEIQRNNSEVNETHEDFRMFGLITFLVLEMAEMLEITLGMLLHLNG